MGTNMPCSQEIGSQNIPPKNRFKNQLSLDLGAHLFVKVPQLGDSELTFSVIESSCHLLLPV